MFRAHRSGSRNADQALDQLGRLLLQQENSMEGVLQTAADLAKQVLPGHPETSVSVLFRNVPTTVVYTDQLAMYCDESQYGRGDGPVCTRPAADNSQRSPTRRPKPAGGITHRRLPSGALSARCPYHFRSTRR